MYTDHNLKIVLDEIDLADLKKGRKLRVTIPGADLILTLQDERITKKG